MITGTDIFIILTTILIFAIDAYLFAKRGEAATISWRFAWWSQRLPIIAVIAGIIIGHLFWPNHGYCQ